MRPPKIAGTVAQAEITFDGPPLSRIPENVIEELTTRGNGIEHIIAGQFRVCCLGILGAQDHMLNTDDLPHLYPHFSVEVEKYRQSVRLIFRNAPDNAFMEGRLTSLRKAHIAAAMRDMVYQSLSFPGTVTNGQRSALVEKMADNAGLLTPSTYVFDSAIHTMPRIVCQGGHTVGSADYDYCKAVGEELGLRHFEGVTGGGPGTMRGVLKGNAKGLMQQRQRGRQIGLTAPEIIAAEPPNVYVTDLAIYPDMEKRLEAFIRICHGMGIFPGGAGTAEEILIALGVKLHEKNSRQELPMILTAHRDAMGYMQAIDEFLRATLGEDVRDLYEVKVDSPDGVARWMKQQMTKVFDARDRNDDSHEWNRSLHFPDELQTPFLPTHENVEALALHRGQPIGLLAAELRKMFKAIVYGSITSDGRNYITQTGKYQIRGERDILDAIDKLLQQFIAEKRMRSTHYEPCYEFVSHD